MKDEAVRGPVYGSDGVVATPHYLASLAGVLMLGEGGSAVDAALAANAVLAVVWPHMCGPGGDLFAQIWSPQEGLVGFNGSGRSGAAMSRDAYREAGLSGVPWRGAMSVTVPGAVDGWMRLHERWGRLDLTRVFGPAVRHARSGFAATPRLCRAIAECETELRTAGATWFFPGARRPTAGDRIIQTDLADTFERLALEGRSLIYGGDLGRRIAGAVAAGGGLLTEDDLAGHAGEWVSALRATYRGVTVCELPPNTQGVTVLEMLNELERTDVSRLGQDSANLIDRLVRSKIRAFRDRDRFVGDPAKVDVPLGRLMDPPDGSDDGKGDTAAPPDGRAAGDTVYLCVADRDGMVVSLIQSIFETFGSGVIPASSGFALHNRGHSFTLESGSPNALEPDKRPRHTLIPGFALRDGRPWLAFGTRGADGQPQTAVQLLVGMLDFGRDAATAVEAPRWVHGMGPAGPGGLVLESRFDRATVGALARRGWHTHVTSAFDDLMGSAQLIEVSQSRGYFIAVADPRGDSVALAA